MQLSKQENTVDRIKGGKLLQRDYNSRFLIDEKYLLLFLLSIIFLVGISMGSESFGNSRRVYYYELFFISLYVLLLRASKERLQWLRLHILTALVSLLLLVVVLLFYLGLPIINLIYLGLVLYAGTFHFHYINKLAVHHKLGLIIVAAWLVIVTLSYYLSPYDIAEHFLGRERYAQVLVHTAFFFVVWDYFRLNKEAVFSVLITIAISTIVIALGTAIVYLTTQQDIIDPWEWFKSPPFSAHMRHIGYQITASLAALLPLLIYKNMGQRKGLLVILLTSLLWAFLFWSGGRSAIASIVLIAFLLSIYFIYKGYQYRRFLILSIGAAIIGLVIAEFLSVFPWNGLGQAISRVTEPGIEDISKLTSGRTQIWLLSWEAVKDHLLLGLGSQGYFFIPDRFIGTIQPHSMFVQFVVEWGLVGAIVFLSMLALAFFTGLKRCLAIVNQNSLIPVLAAGSIITALTLHGIFDGTYYHPQPSFYLAIGFAIWLLPQQESN